MEDDIDRYTDETSAVKQLLAARALLSLLYDQVLTLEIQSAKWARRVK